MYWTYRVRSCDIHMQVLRLSQCREICMYGDFGIYRGLINSSNEESVVVEEK